MIENYLIRFIANRGISQTMEKLFELFLCIFDYILF